MSTIVRPASTMRADRHHGGSSEDLIAGVLVVATPGSERLSFRCSIRPETSPAGRAGTVAGPARNLALTPAIGASRPGRDLDVSDPPGFAQLTTSGHRATLQALLTSRPSTIRPPGRVPGYFGWVSGGPSFEGSHSHARHKKLRRRSNSSRPTSREMRTAFGAREFGDIARSDKDSAKNEQPIRGADRLLEEPSRAQVVTKKEIKSGEVSSHEGALRTSGDKTSSTHRRSAGESPRKALERSRRQRSWGEEGETVEVARRAASSSSRSWTSAAKPLPVE